MRSLCRAAILALPITMAPMLLGAAGLMPDNVTVGQHLEIIANVALGEPSPAGGLRLTLTSADPKLVLFSRTSEEAGSPTLELLVREGYRSSPEFYIQGLGKSGAVAYTVSAPGFASGSGKVTLAPSCVIFAKSGMGTSNLRTTTGAGKVELAMYSVLLDSDLNFVHPQPVAGGLHAKVEITNSNPRVGTITPSVYTISGGSATASIEFQPLSAGETTLSASMPHGFSDSVQFRSVTVSVMTPGMGLTDEIAIGHNLQTHGTVTLGEVAGGEGVTVTLASSDPAKLLLSSSLTEVGSGKIAVKIGRGGFQGSYYLQSLAGVGTVTYKATAPGYRAREATVTLTPSGLVIGGPQGPPDEAELLSKEIAEGPHGFVTTMSAPEPTVVTAFAVQLDPHTLRGADLTVQPVRAGASIKAVLTNSNPSAGKLEKSDLLITGGKSSAVTYFAPATAGSTVVSVVTPAGHTQARNSTSLSVIVKD
jgi:hypothetical protein